MNELNEQVMELVTPIIEGVIEQQGKDEATDIVLSAILDMFKNMDLSVRQTILAVILSNFDIYGNEIK